MELMTKEAQEASGQVDRMREVRGPRAAWAAGGGVVKGFLKRLPVVLFQAEKGLKAQLAVLTEQSSRSQAAQQEKERGLQQLQKTQASLEQEKQKLESQTSELQETVTKKARTDL